MNGRPITVLMVMTVTKLCGGLELCRCLVCNCAYLSRSSVDKMQLAKRAPSPSSLVRYIVTVCNMFTAYLAVIHNALLYNACSAVAVKASKLTATAIPVSA